MTENWDLTRRKSVGVALLSMAAAKEVKNGLSSAEFTFIFLSLRRPRRKMILTRLTMTLRRVKKRP